MSVEYGSLGCYIEGHGQFIDYTDHTLHILFPRTKHTYTIDLKANTMNDKDKLNINCVDYPQSVQISSIKGDEIHIISNVKHFKFDCNDKSLTKIECKKNP
eukprot:552200_1